MNSQWNPYVVRVIDGGSAISEAISFSILMHMALAIYVL
jgi:hypothetical protein